MKTNDDTRMNAEIPQDHVNGVVWTNMDMIIRLQDQVAVLFARVRELEGAIE